jgi:hypothetical protein
MIFTDNILLHSHVFASSERSVWRLENKAAKNHFMHGPGRVASPQIMEIAPLTESGLLDNRRACDEEEALYLTF